VAGLGNGVVDVFDTDGQLLRRFAPRGMAESTGSTPTERSSIPSSCQRQAIRYRWVVDVDLRGGWELGSDTLYFTAGRNGEIDGLFGAITQASQDQ
jgi:hypothetical protein